MKVISFLSVACLSFSLAGCDLGVEADPVEEEEVVRRELTSEERLRKEGANLYASANALPTGTKMAQSRSMAMNHLGMTISQGGKTVANGAANITYEENRETTVVSKSIRKFVIGDAGMKMKVTLRDQPPNETAEPYPLQGQTLVVDGGQVAMEDVPDAAQEEAIKSFRREWVGGNALFTDATIKRRGTWDVTPEEMLEAIFGETFKDGAGTVQLVVQKYFAFEGTDSAEVTVSLDDCAGTMVDAKGQEIAVKLKGYGTLYRSVDPPHTTRVNLDGTVQLNMKQGEADLQFNGPFEFIAKSDLTLPN